MEQGQQRKRMLKLARRIPVEQVEQFLIGEAGSHPRYFVLREHGYEFLCGWHYLHSATQVSMQDDVFYQACCEYLKERGLVFESTEAAVQYARERGLLGG